MDTKKAELIVQAIDGWKTIIGAIGTPIASLLMVMTDEKTTAHLMALGFTIMFGVPGMYGVFNKYQKGQLPNQKLPEGAR